MGLLDRIFRRLQTKPGKAVKFLNKTEIEHRNREFITKYEQVKVLFSSSLVIYNSKHCQCAYPRFQQIVGIDCRDTANSFKSYDTDLLISMSKEYFDISRSELTDEVTNERWICKKCGSIYEYGWSDFSIYIERQKLKLSTLKAEQIGKTSIRPIPLFLGLIGHSYPPRSEITSVDFVEFKKYMTEE